MILLNKPGSKNKIMSLLEKLNYENSHELEQASKLIGEIIIASELPKDLVKEIINFYDNLEIKENKYFKNNQSILKAGFQRLNLCIELHWLPSDHRQPRKIFRPLHLPVNRILI